MKIKINSKVMTSSQIEKDFLSEVNIAVGKNIRREEREHLKEDLAAIYAVLCGSTILQDTDDLIDMLNGGHKLFVQFH